MITKYIYENLYVVTIYYKLQIYFLSDSNNCKTWWSTSSYIEYELIVPFQLQLKKFTHVISQKTSRQVFHSNEYKCVEKKTFCWKITSIWTVTKIILEVFVSKSILYVYQNVKWNQRKKFPQNIPKYNPKKIHFFT
jgi:hypothetical protein